MTEKSFLVILKRANFDGLMKNLVKNRRESSEVGQEARLRMTEREDSSGAAAPRGSIKTTEKRRLPRGGRCRQRRLRESAL